MSAADGMDDWGDLFGDDEPGSAPAPTDLDKAIKDACDQAAQPDSAAPSKAEDDDDDANSLPSLQSDDNHGGEGEDTKGLFSDSDLDSDLDQKNENDKKQKTKKGDKQADDSKSKKRSGGKTDHQGEPGKKVKKSRKQEKAESKSTEEYLKELKETHKVTCELCRCSSTEPEAGCRGVFGRSRRTLGILVCLSCLLVLFDWP